MHPERNKGNDRPWWWSALWIFNALVSFARLVYQVLRDWHR
jgi:hypothetical protein